MGLIIKWPQKFVARIKWVIDVWCLENDLARTRVCFYGHHPNRFQASPFMCRMLGHWCRHPPGSLLWSQCPSQQFRTQSRVKREPELLLFSMQTLKKTTTKNVYCYTFLLSHCTGISLVILRVMKASFYFLIFWPLSLGLWFIFSFPLCLSHPLLVHILLYLLSSHLHLEEVLLKTTVMLQPILCMCEHEISEYKFSTRILYYTPQVLIVFKVWKQ